VMCQMQAWGGPRLKVLKLSLYGEPLLNRSFAEMLRLARASDIAERIETTTNASLLTEEVSRAMVAGGLDYLRVSVYSPDQARHECVTGSRVTVEAIRENLALLQRIKGECGTDRPFVSVKMLDTYSAENDLFLSRYSDVADEVYLDKPHNWSGVRDSRFIDGLYGADVAKARQDLERDSSPRVACTLPFYVLAVRSNGDVSPCCVDWAGGTTLGNVKTETLEQVWNGDRLWAFRKMQLEDRKHENESCGRCEVYRSDYYTRDNIDGFPVEKLRRNPGGTSG